MKIDVEYWDCLRRTKEYKDVYNSKGEFICKGGGLYQDNSSEVIRIESIEKATKDEIFEEFYKMNNRLRYCNGSYYKFLLPIYNDEYRQWLIDLPKERSFNLFYGNGVVD